jgi:hypothetical protein
MCRRCNMHSGILVKYQCNSTRSCYKYRGSIMHSGINFKTTSNSISTCRLVPVVVSVLVKFGISTLYLPVPYIYSTCVMTTVPYERYIHRLLHTGTGSVPVRHRCGTCSDNCRSTCTVVTFLVRSIPILLYLLYSYHTTYRYQCNGTVLLSNRQTPYGTSAVHYPCMHRTLTVLAAYRILVPV